MVFFFNDTQAIIGKNVQIVLPGAALVEAVNKSNVRIIAGSLSASQSNVGAGLTLSCLLYTSSSSQATGALAINIVFNRNDAFIDTDGNVTAGGELSVTATADTYAHSNADGSNFDESSAGQITPCLLYTSQSDSRMSDQILEA